jgi:hypothetical protein
MFHEAVLLVERHQFHPAKRNQRSKNVAKSLLLADQNCNRLVEAVQICNTDYNLQTTIHL